MQEKSAFQLGRKVMSGKTPWATLIVTQPMGTHMEARRRGVRTITIVTTTWTIRWWDGAMWVERTLGPSVAVTFGTEATSSPDEPARDTAPASPPDQPAQNQGE
jgi:hypothetical protein